MSPFHAIVMKSIRPCLSQLTYQIEGRTILLGESYAEAKIA